MPELQRADARSGTPVVNRWRLLRLLLLGVLLALALVQFSRAVHDVSELLPFRHVLNLGWLGASILLQVLQYAGDGYFTRRLLRILRFDVPLRDSIRIAALDIFGATLLPLGQFSTLAAGYYFYRRRGLPAETIIFLDAAVVGITGFVLVTLFLVALATVPAGALPRPVSYGSAAVVAIVLVIALVALVLLAGSTGVRAAVSERLRSYAWYGRLKAMLEAWPREFGRLAGRRLEFAGVVVAKDVVYYLLEIASIETCFLALHTAPHLALVATAYFVSLVLGYAAMTPAGLGATEATLAVLFLAAGIAPSTVVGVIVLYRLVNVVLPAPFGTWCFFSLRREQPAVTAGG